ncbi:cytochrome P450 [Fomitopsis serialis]|uniref:cytochrome P450 n=1 Tax=Fomitopsis serialis TaxID=139415 RepID=UPI00200870AF|nr:cytochrome P450 [Neoantrodia serialis]KAH9933882.1 cytochrome P450 [Neoantrodia serialis]
MLDIARAVVSLTVIWTVSYLIRVYLVASSLPKLPGPPSESFVTGNLKQWFSRNADAFQKHVALDYGPVARLHGMIGWPLLYVSDPKALHTILVKEELSYLHRKELMIGNRLMFGEGVFATLGKYTHTRQRKMLNPVFSTNLGHMFPIFYDVLRNGMRASIDSGENEQDVMKRMTRAALEAIGRGGLGHSFDPLVKDSQDAFADAITSFNPKMTRLSYLRRFIPYLSWLGPAWFRRFLVRLMPKHWAIPQVYSVVRTINQRSAEIYESKKAASQEGGADALKSLGNGKDLMSILMRANMAASVGEHLSDDAVLGQMTTFVFGALDTTAAMLSRILQLLAVHQGVQRELRQELLEARAAEGVAYDQLDALPLLDSACRERVVRMLRVTNAQRDGVLPLSQPIMTVDGQTLSEIVVSKGTEIIIGTYGSNVNAEVWGPDALEWKPERWSKILSSVAAAHIPSVYSHLMTFSAGRRACIGFKFSEMEMKVLLAVLVTNFAFELSEKPVVWNVADGTQQ